MIDEKYKVWLIEVNSSPTMEYSTKVTTRIVQKGMSDLADLVQNYMFGNKYYRHDKAKQFYGGWKLLTNR
jgi:tubulin monoglycylase TTLL3/8